MRTFALHLTSLHLAIQHHAHAVQHRAISTSKPLVQWSEDVIKGDPFFGRSRVRFRVRPWASNTIARDHLA